ncbi:MAG: hypothetical protein Fur0025_00210 [Oscillatoriaceae cyanobacterium]
MSKFKLFDAVSLTGELILADGSYVPPGTSGTIVEVLPGGQAYLVELFGGWVKAEVGGDFLPASPDEPDAFMETIGIETVAHYQLQLVPSQQKLGKVRSHLLALLDNLSDDLVAEVCDFAEFLQQKQQKNTPS